MTAMKMPLAYDFSMYRRIVAMLGLVLASLLSAGCQSGGNLREPTAAVAQDVDPLAKNYTQLGLGYMREGEYELAWRRLHRALEIAPDYSAAHNGMGLLYERLKQPSKADEEYSRAVTLNPTDSSAQTNYGSFLCREGRVEEAEQRFLQALKNSLYATPENAYANAGVCLHGAGQDEKAERYLRSALERNPKLPTALLTMAEIRYDAKKMLSARAYLQRYLEVGEQTPKVLWLGIRIERELGDRQAVASYAARLRSRFPDAEETALLLESTNQ